MKNKIDNILLSILWLLVATLGTSFWFSSQFGFNVFSSAHWQYLSELQATQKNVSVSFYASFVIITIITLTVLYFLIRPKFRKIKLPIVKTGTQSEAQQPTIIQQPSINPDRPQRLNLPKIISNTNARPQSVTPTTFTRTPAPQPALKPLEVPKDYTEVKKLFTDLGYTVKPDIKVGDTGSILFAISPDETIWVGGADISVNSMDKLINKLGIVFTDSLEDISLEINSFVINPTDTGLTQNDIETFDTIDDLKEYMQNRHAPTLPNDQNEIETFDAFSEYIDTVINYINKT